MKPLLLGLAGTAAICAALALLGGWEQSPLRHGALTLLAAAGVLALGCAIWERRG